MNSRSLQQEKEAGEFNLALKPVGVKALKYLKYSLGQRCA